VKGENWKGTFKRGPIDKYEGDTIDGYLVDTGYACAAILVGDNGIVLDAAPIFKWMIGKRLEDIRKWKKIRGISESIKHNYKEE